MGNVAIARLAYGVNFEEENPLQNAKRSKILEAMGKLDSYRNKSYADYRAMYDSEKFKFFLEYDKAMGILPPETNEYPIDVVWHCRSSYSMHLLILDKYRYGPWRGECEKITKESLDVDDEDTKFFIDFCERFGIECDEPAWLLCPYTED